MEQNVTEIAVSGANEILLDRPTLACDSLSVFYGGNEAVKSVSLQIREKEVCALIGPSGCGKSTLLRCFNRMNDFIDSFRVQGEIFYRGKEIYEDDVSAELLRRKVGMVFQKPNPFPMSIEKNITWAPKLHGLKFNKEELVESALRKAALWDEVKDRLKESGLALSGGQQQRLCIARAIAMNPDAILMDEPCAALDPVSTSKIEELISELKKDYTIIIVTHNMHQARRISDRTLFMYQGELVESGPTQVIFENPREELTRRYVAGAFG